MPVGLFCSLFRLCPARLLRGGDPGAGFWRELALLRLKFGSDFVFTAVRACSG